MANQNCPNCDENGKCKKIFGDKCNADEKSILKSFEDSFENLEQIDVLDVCPRSSIFGNEFFTITDADIEALKSGKVLCYVDEYGTFIRYSGS